MYERIICCLLEASTLIQYQYQFCIRHFVCNHCTAHSAQFTVHSTQCIVNSSQCTVHITQYTVHCTLYTVHSTQYKVHRAHCTVHSAQYTVHSAHFTYDRAVTLGYWVIFDCVRHYINQLCVLAHHWLADGMQNAEQLSTKLAMDFVTIVTQINSQALSKYLCKGIHETKKHF